MNGFATFTGPVKPFCPCDTDRPEDCKPEEWPRAHAHRDCERCGRPSYQHLMGSDEWRCRDPLDPRRAWLLP